MQWQEVEGGRVQPSPTSCSGLGIPMEMKWKQGRCGVLQRPPYSGAKAGKECREHQTAGPGSDLCSNVSHGSRTTVWLVVGN